MLEKFLKKNDEKHIYCYFLPTLIHNISDKNGLPTLLPAYKQSYIVWICPIPSV